MEHLGCGRNSEKKVCKQASDTWQVSLSLSSKDLVGYIVFFAGKSGDVALARTQPHILSVHAYLDDLHT